MPVKERIVASIPLSRYGVDWFSAPHDVRPGFAMQTKNCYFRRGMQGRLGHSKHSANQVVSGKAIVGAHRFYGLSGGVTLRQLIAVAGDSVKYLHTDDTWTSIRGSQSDSAQTHITTWSAVNKAYIANKLNAPFSWNGATATTLSGLPAKTKMFLPYRSRLLLIEDDNPTLLRWTDGDYTDTGVITTAQAIRMVGGGSIEVIAPHALAGNQEGINAAVLVATGSSCAMFFATNLDPATWGQTGTGNYGVRLDHISDTVGTVAPRSVVNTPVGTIFLGTDRQIYLLPYGSFQLRPIGNKVRSGSADSLGIESIPAGQMTAPCAAYHDGFYKLAYAVSGGSTNTHQVWLDVTRLAQDEDGEWGPWFGPMTGMSVSCFTVQNGSGDDGRLIAGNGLATGYVYRANEPGVYADDGTAIPVTWQTHHHLLSGSIGLNVALEQMEVEMAGTGTGVYLSFQDTDGPRGQRIAMEHADPALYYGDFYYGEQDYSSGTSITRMVHRLDDAGVRGRQLATMLEYTSATERFSCLALRHEARALESTFPLQEE